VVHDEPKRFHPGAHSQKVWLMYEISESGAQINRFWLTDLLFQEYSRILGEGITILIGVWLVNHPSQLVQVAEETT